LTAEVRNGLLKLNGQTLPLRKGIILLALARAGWAGGEGDLSGDLFRGLLRADPRVAFAAGRPAPALSA
jgi:hypothetical protein